LNKNSNESKKKKPRKEETFSQVIHNRWSISFYAFFCCLPFVGDPLAISLGFFRTSFFKVSLWMFLGKFVKYILWAILTVWGISIF